MTNSAVSPEEEGRPITPEEVRRLARLVEENGLSELFFEDGDIRIVLRTAAYHPVLPPSSAGPVPLVTTLPAPATVGEPAEETIEPEAAPILDDSRMRRIEAPIMGVFYRASAQNDPPFVEVGDTVTEGQVIGLIEAMKVFSEVPSPVAGRVIDIPARNGALVQPGDTLILLETD